MSQFQAYRRRDLIRKEKPMNAKEYGRHASGYRKPEASELSRGFTRRLILWAVVFAVCLVWLMTHPACATPLANGICAFVAFLGVPIRLMALLAAETGID